jgi:MoxR-like ATPase
MENKLDLSSLNSAIQNIHNEIAKVIVGQKEMIDLIICALLSNGHVLIEGVPGVAKTLTAKLVANIMQLNFKRIQFTPDLMPSDVIGTTIYNFQTSVFEFKPGPIFSNFVLIDEINRAPAKTQSALFEVMEERQITIDGKTHIMDLPFIAIATQNPIEQEGTYRLPEAQLDRFLFKIIVSYPSFENEIDIIKNEHNRANRSILEITEKIINGHEIIELQQMIKKVTVEESLIKYIADITHATRNNKSLYLGASPRASIALLNASKSFAVMNGRDFVIPDDIKYVAKPILRHRISLTADKDMDGTTTDEVIQDILLQIETPK